MDTPEVIPMRVLVVEDEVRLAATLQDLLELNGYTVTSATTASRGWTTP